VSDRFCKRIVSRVIVDNSQWSHYINSISPIIQKLNNEQEQEEDNKEHTLPNGGRSTKTSAVQNTQH
jgi:hypothetical protein